MHTICPTCGDNGGRSFYSVSRVPSHSVLLMDTYNEAVTFPKGDIELYHCDNCGFIWNARFNPELEQYSSRYEETQGFSPTFNSFHKRLAEDLIQRHDLHDKEIIEIGCGKGEFLALLCELGPNKGIGFDPAYIDDRNTSEARERMTFIKDFYSEKYVSYQADFICCKMTLEHIPDTSLFIQTVRKSITRTDTTVFFQIPDAVRVIGECAFWDIYYEHCSYFTPQSLTYLFEQNGFDVLRVWTDYDDQYLMMEAKPKSGLSASLHYQDQRGLTNHDIDHFVQHFKQQREYWLKAIQNNIDQHKKMAIWGAGSKAVAFLTTLGITDEIPYGVDINPFKHDTYLAGNGQKIVAPEFLKEYQPDVVYVMNPIYIPEISGDLGKFDLNPKLIPIEHKQGSMSV